MASASCGDNSTGRMEPKQGGFFGISVWDSVQITPVQKSFRIVRASSRSQMRTASSQDLIRVLVNTTNNPSGEVEICRLNYGQEQNLCLTFMKGQNVYFRVEENFALVPAVDLTGFYLEDEAETKSQAALLGGLIIIQLTESVDRMILEMKQIPNIVKDTIKNTIGESLVGLKSQQQEMITKQKQLEKSFTEVKQIQNIVKYTIKNTIDESFVGLKSQQQEMITKQKQLEKSFTEVKQIPNIVKDTIKNTIGKSLVELKSQQQTMITKQNQLEKSCIEMNQIANIINAIEESLGELKSQQQTMITKFEQLPNKIENSSGIFKVEETTQNQPYDVASSQQELTELLTNMELNIIPKMKEIIDVKNSEVTKTVDSMEKLRIKGQTIEHLEELLANMEGSAAQLKKIMDIRNDMNKIADNVEELRVQLLPEESLNAVEDFWDLLDNIQTGISTAKKDNLSGEMDNN